MKHLQRLPSGLIAKESKFKDIANDFRPHYKIVLRDYPVCNMLKGLAEQNDFAPIGPVSPDLKVRDEYNFVPQKTSHTKLKYILGKLLGTFR